MNKKIYILIYGIFIELLLAILIFILFKPLTLQEEQKITLKGNVGYIHGFLLAKDYLFGLTNTTPAKLVKVSIKNLSDYKLITFPADGKHDNGTELVHVNNKLYLVFGGHGSYVSELNPDDLSYQDIYSSKKDYSDPVVNLPSITTDGKKLYVISSTKPTYLHTINLKNFQDVTTISLNEKLNYGHSIRYDRGYLYATGEQDNGWLAKINSENLQYKEILFGKEVSTPTDDLAATDKYIFTCFENKSGIIYRINKNTLSFDKINTGVFATCFGVHFDGTSVWAVYDTNPGQVIRFDPEKLIVSKYDLTESHPSEIQSQKNNLYMSFWGLPAKIMKIRFW